MRALTVSLIVCLACSQTEAFQFFSNVKRTTSTTSHSTRQLPPIALFASEDNSNNDSDGKNDVEVAADSSLDASSRLPTSVEDQVRQAALSLQRAAADGYHRHSIRLLLPLIGATDLDDWPGGARQMMEAAYPLVQDILKTWAASSDNGDKKDLAFNQVLLDASDGVYAILTQAAEASDDKCTLLLPTADTVPQIRDSLEQQVGPKRDMIIVNTQWKRRSDFNTNSGGLGFLFGGNNKEQKLSDDQYMETTFAPTFSLTNLIVEGENIRVLRTYPGPWRVFVREQEEESGVVDWILLGEKKFVEEKPDTWEQDAVNQRDGGLLFQYGMPSYQEIMDMLTESPDYVPKNPAERALAAFNFIKDTL